MCNCSKPSAARPRPAARPTAGVSGASGSATQAFSLLLSDGSRQSFGSRLEADAANARSGYTGVVRQNS